MRQANLRGLGLAGLTVLLLAATWASAEIRLPAIIGDNMVLQRDMSLPIWGWTKAGEKVTVTFAGQSATATADKDGKWIVRLPALKANDKPQTMTILAGDEKLTVKNVLVGEVWLGSGQSNMEMSVGSCNNAQQEIDAAKYPTLRFFNVERRTSSVPRDDLKGSWVECSPHAVGGFSGTAYFFGRDLLQSLKVPVGMISSSWGGTPIEAWCNLDAFAGVGREKEVLRNIQMADIAQRDYPQGVRKYIEALTLWEKAANCYDYHNDGFDLGWANPGNDPREWQDAKDHLKFDSIGAVWFRREVDIPKDWAGNELVLELGVIDDYDTTYINGLEVGQTDKKTLNYWMHPRVYRVPGHCTTAGKNLIAVRVFNNYVSGDFSGKGKLYPVKQSDKAISLDGGWQYRVERTQNMRNTTGIPKPIPPTASGNANMPTVLYNGMIHPLVPYALRGAIWYQGESNAYDAIRYRALLASMIQAWRKVWEEKEMAFGIVQLPNFTDRNPVPEDPAWARFRETQAMVAATVPNTGLAVTIDIGDAKDIHPKNKQDVGKRLALWARVKVYGQDIPYSGPMYKDMKVEGNKIRISFDHINGGLVAKDDKPLVGFAIAGKDGKFVWADAKIDGDTVLVWSDKIAEPTTVRYAWAYNPDCNLYNKANLPAAPFRTDTPK